MAASCFLLSTSPLLTTQGQEGSESVFVQSCAFLVIDLHIGTVDTYLHIFPSAIHVCFEFFQYKSLIMLVPSSLQHVVSAYPSCLMRSVTGYYDVPLRSTCYFESRLEHDNTHRFSCHRACQRFSKYFRELAARDRSMDINL